MNCKFLIKNTLFNSTSKWRLPSVLIQTTKNQYIHFLIYEKKPIQYKILNSNLSKNDKLFANLILNQYKDQIRTAIRGGPGYTNYGHGRYKPRVSKFAYFWYAFLVCGITCVLFVDFETLGFRGHEPEQKMEDFKKVYDRISNPKAKEISNNSNNIDNIEESEVNQDEDSDGDNKTVDSTQKKKEKATFRNRKIMQYENKIRQYSTPDKVFRYFATLKIWNEKLNDYEIFMTPEDFIRSLTYGAKQPERLGLDSYNKYDPHMQKLASSVKEDSIFKHLNKEGLISFSDYIFLVTLLSIPTRHFEIAFHMFDTDGNGNLDLEEYEQLQGIIRNQTSLGQRHRDTRMTGSVIKENSTLNEYFFGKELNDLLTVQKFTDFQKKLQTEVIRMEFEFYDLKETEDGRKIINEEKFCEMILAYAGFNSSKTKKILKRVSKIYNEENSKGISLHDYEQFFKVLRSIHDIDTALKFYAIAGASIDKSILKHVAKTVANADLSDNVIEVIFNLFDENGDGKLSHKEFIKVMKKRWSRGLQTPKDTGFVKFVEALGSCANEMIFKF